jgi:hypothetical protein
MNSFDLARISTSQSSPDHGIPILELQQHCISDWFALVQMSTVETKGSGGEQLKQHIKIAPKTVFLV